MKKTTLSTSFIILFAFYMAYQRLNGDAAPLVVPPKSLQTPAADNSGNGSPAPASPPPAETSPPPPAPPTSTPLPTPAPKPTPTPAPAPKPTPPPPAPAPKPVGMYKDGQYTGPSTDAYYGNVQVKAIIQNGKITDVQFLDYPQDRGTSREINRQAMPYLTQEAIQAQSANVNIVSGATDTSLAFRQSLAPALAQAKN